ncbi:hypothetical protein ACFZAM_04045 [Streptomyces sp. NPDC008079]|uniref:hypothetical protein n=1 Tax=Streptomyces sp. NPDC008079 TaxID=3364806 RepID=UPI0036E5F89C
MRVRIERTNFPRPGLYLTDSPRPRCGDCDGQGIHEWDYGDDTGEYAGTDWAYCPCWNPDGRWLLLPLPHRPRWLPRRGTGRDPWGPGDYSNEPPF